MVFNSIKSVIGSLQETGITQERKNILDGLIAYIVKKQSEGLAVRLNFICTHNSRRSHLSQIWAQTMAHYFGLNNIFCYSGGTEATAMFPMVAKVLEKTGFEIRRLSEGSNPVYGIKFAGNEHPVIAFSKAYDDPFNPGSAFAAIMTCSQADAGCPMVIGAEQRIALTYEDPKLFDGTPQQEEKYLERSMQIAAEMKYIFSKIKS
ncbi:MAG: protein-tyrosine-phosphatase [Flavobacteriaceae bacterium]|nr:protein-tyrosine-phosphatase [Flavobacteriaceae bacterium]